MLSPGKYNSQADNILKHLMDGHSINPLDALEQYGVFRLAAVIHNLRARGYKIKTKKISNKRGKSFASYKLETNVVMPAARYRR